MFGDPIEYFYEMNKRSLNVWNILSDIATIFSSIKSKALNIE